MLVTEESEFRKQVFLKWKKAAARLPLSIDTDLVGGRIDVLFKPLGHHGHGEMSKYTWVINKHLSLKENVRSILEWAWEECPMVVKHIQTIPASPETIAALKRIGKAVEATEYWRITQISIKKDTLLILCNGVHRLVKTKIPATVLLHRLNAESDPEKRSELFFSKITELKVLADDPAPPLT